MLLSANATQNITSISEHKLIRNINGKIIDLPNVQQLFKCTIKTTDVPNVEYLRVGGIYAIYSIVKFYSSTVPLVKYVPNSLIKTDTGYTYRPILSATLINFECDKNYDMSIWTLTFETNSSNADIASLRIDKK